RPRWFALRCKMGPPSRAFWSPQRPWSPRNLKRRRPCPQCRLVVAWTTNIDQWTRRLGPDTFSINVRRSYLVLLHPPGAVKERQSSPRKKGRLNLRLAPAVMSLRKMRHLSFTRLYND